jgi:hypothetical protein
MQYEIDPKLGSPDQIGLRLKCESQSQAEKIHLALRKESLKISRLMPSNHSGFTHFVYVSATESQVRSCVSKIEPLFNASNPQISTEQVHKQAKDTLNFRSWQNLFRGAVKKLNNDSPRPISLTQEINQTRLSEEIAAGHTTEIEDKLLRQANFNDSNALRTLITLYAQTEQHEQIVELCKAKRSEILALPVSGRLVEQLIVAHLQHSQQTNVPEFLLAAQQIAQEFLPELERLHQANSVRKLLHQVLNPQEAPPTVTGVTLSEQLAQLLEIEPGDKISRLKSLHNEYPKATNVILALAESYTAIGNTEQALQLYRSIPEQTEEIQQLYLSLLIDSDRSQEVLEFLPESINELSPVLSGLRGVALARLGQKPLARNFLEKAWHEGQRSIQILLPLARLWAEEGDPIQAGAAYQILQETADNQLTSQDYALMARVSNLGGFGDLSDEQKANYYEECVARADSDLLNLSISSEILKDRLELWKGLNNVEELLNAYADWLDWLANAGQIEDLERELAQLRSLATQQRISFQQHFELLEGIEPFVDALPKLRQGLVNDYFGIALKEIDNAIRQGQSEAIFFQDLQRALLYLNRESVQEVVEYRRQKQVEAQELGIQIAPEEVIFTEAPNLSSLNLALVGGHASTRKEVIRELQERYCLKDATEVAPSNEASVNRANVQTKIGNCDLIAMITGYMGHDLSQIVSELKKNGALTGEVLPLSCRGKSGVVREILIWWSKQR